MTVLFILHFFEHEHFLKIFNSRYYFSKITENIFPRELLLFLINPFQVSTVSKIEFLHTVSAIFDFWSPAGRGIFLPTLGTSILAGFCPKFSLTAPKPLKIAARSCAWGSGALRLEWAWSDADVSLNKIVSVSLNWT